MNIILGITGSIAAYKAADLANTLAKQGHSVYAVMTDAAQKFITPLTLQTLTKNPVYTDMFAAEKPEEVAHIALAQKADLVIIAPASADFIAKAAAGIADDMLTTVMLPLKKDTPIILCPAMNTFMYDNPVTQRNLAALVSLGRTKSALRLSGASAALSLCGIALIYIIHLKTVYVCSTMS